METINNDFRKQLSVATKPEITILGTKVVLSAPSKHPLSLLYKKDWGGGKTSTSQIWTEMLCDFKRHAFLDKMNPSFTACFLQFFKSMFCPNLQRHQCLWSAKTSMVLIYQQHRWYRKKKITSWMERMNWDQTAGRAEREKSWKIWTVESWLSLSYSNMNKQNWDTGERGREME